MRYFERQPDVAGQAGRIVDRDHGLSAGIGDADNRVELGTQAAGPQVDGQPLAGGQPDTVPVRLTGNRRAIGCREKRQESGRPFPGIGKVVDHHGAKVRDPASGDDADRSEAQADLFGQRDRKDHLARLVTRTGNSFDLARKAGPQGPCIGQVAATAGQLDRLARPDGRGSDAGQRDGGE